MAEFGCSSAFSEDYWEAVIRFELLPPLPTVGQFESRNLPLPTRYLSTLNSSELSGMRVCP